jgi:glycosyltransferase involved in cell wall biosynthesis
MTLLLDLLLRAGRRVPAVYTPQEMQSNSPRPHFDAASRRLMQRMQHVVYNSEDNRVFARQRWGLSQQASSVAGVPDLLAFVRQDLRPQPPPIPAGRPLLLCFGLIEQRKGIPTLIEAFALLRRTRPDAHLAIVGKPLMDLAVLEEAIGRHGLAGHVDLVPEYVSFERMAGYFERAAALVLPYEAGWNSGVIPVALGYRKPVVATTIASAAEAVAHGETGLLVPPATPQALSEALLRIIGDTALLQHMQAPLEAAGQAQGWGPLVAGTEALYRQLTRAAVG